MNSHNLLENQHSISAASPLNLPKEPPYRRVHCKLALSDPKTMSTLSARDHVAATERGSSLFLFLIEDSEKGRLRTRSCNVYPSQSWLDSGLSFRVYTENEVSEWKERSFE